MGGVGKGQVQGPLFPEGRALAELGRAGHPLCLGETVHASQATSVPTECDVGAFQDHIWVRL